jgi:hypothetical protein
MKHSIPYRLAGLLAMIFFLVLAASSCYNDNEYDLYPFSAQCDSLQSSYSKTIVPILSTNCYVCHSTAQQLGGIILDTYAGASEQAKNGNLWAAVSWQSGYIPMPKGGSKLSDCDLGKIKNWINQGSPNN